MCQLFERRPLNSLNMSLRSILNCNQMSNIPKPHLTKFKESISHSGPLFGMLFLMKKRLLQHLLLFSDKLVKWMTQAYFLIEVFQFAILLLDSTSPSPNLLLLCSHSPNDVPPEPQRNVFIAAVRGAVRPSNTKLIILDQNFISLIFEVFHILII